MLKKGNSRNAVLAFWNMNENKYEYPMNEKANKNRINKRYPATSVRNDACSPKRKTTKKKIDKGKEKMSISNVQLPAQYGSLRRPNT